MDSDQTKTDQQTGPVQNHKTSSRFGSWLASALFFAIAGGLTLVIFATEPVAQREGATRNTAMLVETLTVSKQDYQPSITAMGTVKPAREVKLSTRVSGNIITRTDSFDPGALLEQGDILVKLDPADYRLALQQRKSELVQAEAALATEMGEQINARRAFESLNRSLPDQQKALVLREPQLRSAKAQVELAEAALQQAQLDIKRTVIRAPFDAQVMARNVEVGAHVSQGNVLGRLVGVDRYWVEVSLPVSKLDWLASPPALQNDPAPDAAAVKIRDSNSWSEGDYRIGRLHQVVGELDEQTRMARILVTVFDPLGLETAAPALLAGSYVEAVLPAKPLQQVVRLPREYLRKNDTVWVMEKNQLAIKSATVIFKDDTYVYIQSGVDDQARVITTDLSTIREGAGVREKPAATSGEAEATDA